MAKKEQGERVSHLDKVIQQAMGEGREVGCADDPARERWPALWEWLTRIYVGRDDMKQPASITINAAPGGIMIRISDRDLGVSVSAATAHLGDALDAIEAALGSDTPAITSWGNKEPKLRKRQRRN